MRQFILYLCEIFGIEVRDVSNVPIVREIPGENKNVVVRYDSVNDIEYGEMGTDDGSYRMWWQQKGRNNVWSN